MYPPYDGRGLDLKRVVAEQGLKIKNIVDLLVTEIGHNIEACSKKQQTEDRGIINITLDLAEMVHYGSSHKVYCIDKESCGGLLSQRNDVKVKELSLPISVFEICIEKGTKITGFENSDFDLPSCLVLLPSPTVACAVAKMHLLTLDYCFGFDKLAASGKDPKATEQRSNMVKIIDGLIQPGDFGLYQPFINWMTVIFTLRGNWMYFQMPLTGELTINEEVDRFNAEGEAKRDIVDVQCQKDLTKLIFNFLTCVQVDPSVLQPYKFHDRPTLSLVKPKAEAMEKMGFHLRCSHYRTLRDTRFYKGIEYPPKDWRITHVKESLVKKHAEPSNPLKRVMAVLEKNKTRISDERHPKH